MTNRDGRGEDLGTITRALEQLREQLARQPDRPDPAAVAQRIHDDLEEIQERLRLFGDRVAAQLAAHSIDPNAGRVETEGSAGLSRGRSAAF